MTNPTNDQTSERERTHGENCYLWDRHHYECALREIERLRAEVAEAKRDARMLRLNAKAREDSVASIGCELVQDGDVYVLVNARAETAERELAALRERFDMAPVYDVPQNAPSTKAQFAEAIASVRVLTELRGHRVRLVREEDT